MNWGRHEEAHICFGWALLLSSAYPALALGPVWTNISNGLTGVVPGVSQLLIGSDGSTFYSLATGGLFKSADGGSSWTTLGTITGVNAIALNPTSASTLYAGTANGVVKTTDGGQSWSQAGLSDGAVSVLALDPHTPSTLYANGAAGSIYKSVDSGANWTSSILGSLPNQSGGVSIAFIAIDPLTPSTVYVLTEGPRATMYKSTDGGQSWSIITNLGDFYATVLVTDPSVPSKLYANRDGMGLSTSTDGGTTWAATGLNDYPIALAIDPTNSNTLYASTASDTSQTILKSTDGGRTWVLVDKINATVPTAIPVIRSLVFGPNASVYVTTGGGIFNSIDGGMTWTEANTGLRILSIRTLVGDPMNTATIYAGGDHGLFKSVDGGANWTQRATFQVQAPPESTPFPPVALPAEVHSMVIDFTNPNVMYVATARPGGCYSGDTNLLKSVDGGSNWSGLEPFQGAGCETTDIMAMDPIDPNTLYLPLGDDWVGLTVYKTTDAGAHWTSTGCPPPYNCWGLIPGDEVNAFLIDPNTPGTLYAASDFGVFRSTDGGASFLAAGIANTEVALLAIDPRHSKVLYAAASNIYNPPSGFLGMYKSTDGGSSWSSVNQGLGEIIAAHPTVNALLVDAADTGVLFLATSGFGVFKSSDGGASWAPFNNGLTNLDVHSLTLVHGSSWASHRRRSSPTGSSTLYAGTPGGVFKLEQFGR
jgi:photosystem II stability/assembly factor-like uncharacterized protein